MTVNKNLITLTHLYVNEGHVSFALTDGTTTLRGSTSPKKNLVLDIAYLAWELTNGGFVAKDLLAANPRENMKRYFRFAVDEEVTKALVLHYKQNGEDAVIKVAEDVVNLFDEVNGNKAVSNVMGIANLVVGISTDRLSLEDESEKKPIPQIRELIELMYFQDPWNHETQGLKILTGKIAESGEDIEFNIVHAVGNVYMEGRIGKLGIRVFKQQNVQAYIGWGTDYPDRPEVFPLRLSHLFEERLYEMVEHSANTPA